MLWAILTNRTLLWKYWDYETCRRWNSRFEDQSICNITNRASQCESILTRAGWIPSYDEWSQKLGLEEPVELPYYATHHESVKTQVHSWQYGDERYYGVDNQTKYPHNVVIFALARTKIDWLKDLSIRDTMLTTSWSRGKSSELYHLGANFLYGMLFRYSFDFAHMAKKGIAEYHQKPDASSFTVALHSRHQFKEYMGCNTRREIACINSVTANVSGSIHFYIMADRNCTLQNLRSYLLSRNDRVNVPLHDQGSSFKDEHGPYAGVGFFQDLALSSQAKSAFIGTKRSSSDLLLELIDFNRKLEWWKSGKQVQDIPEIPICVLQPLPLPPHQKLRKHIQQYYFASKSP